MEDRHYISEPRPIHGLVIPTWEVDILREGVDDPIMTLILDRNKLPPRKSKKKTVWKLPDDVNILPKFGVQDKKRILDMYKEKKKEVKKLMRQAARMPSQSSGDQSTDEDQAAKEIAENFTNDMDYQGDNNNEKSSMDRQQKVLELPNSVKQDHSSASSSPSPPPGLETLSLDTATSIASETPQKVTMTHSDPIDLLSAQPNHLPPGLNFGHFPGITLAPHPPPGMSSNSSSIVPETSTGVFRSLPPLLPVPGRCFIHPSMAISPLMQTPATLAAVANLVTESYYLLLHRGLINELASYYAMDAQKSLTVGGAYAVCTSAGDRLLQLQSLAGTIKPHIKGIQQQPTLAGGVMVMITGVSVRPPAGLLLPFCHTLVLCPVSTNVSTASTQQGQPHVVMGYQIQNDNLVFLTGDDAPTGTSNGGIIPSANGVELS